MTLLVARKCLALGARHSKGFALETFRGPVVLAVEDEPLILMLAVDMIRDAGFEPLWASNAEEAISILESRDEFWVPCKRLAQSRYRQDGTGKRCRAGMLRPRSPGAA